MRPPVPDIGTVPPLRGAVLAVSPAVLARVGGLPVTALEDIGMPKTMLAVREAEDHRTAADRLTVAVEEDLYRIVPGLDADRVARRTVLGLRRDVHNGRWTRRTETAVDAVVPMLPEPAADRLQDWADAVRRCHESLDTAAASLPAEMSLAGDAMLRRLREPGVAAGLALASPEFTNRLLAGSTLSGMDSRFARSATAYLTRIAVKTSPFSSLTTVAMTSFADGVPAGGVDGGADSGAGAEITTTRALAVGLLLACARDRRTAGLLDVVANTGLHRVDGRWLASLPSYVVAEGLSFRHDELTDCTEYDWAIGRLPTRPHRADELGEPDGEFAAAGPELVARLIEVGLLQPVLPWAAFDGAVFGRLADAVRSRVPAGLQPFSTAVDELGRVERRLAGNTDAAVRVAATGAARTAARQAFRGLGQPTPSWAESLPLFHEVVMAAPGLAPSLPPVVRDDIAEAANWLAPVTMRDPRYDYLVSCFVRRYGAGGVCAELIDFLYAFHTRVDLRTLSPAGPRRPADEAAADRLRGHGTVGPASHTILFQVAGADQASVAAGQYELPVNLINNGGGGLLGRWASVPALRPHLDAAVQAWAQAKYPGCRVYQVSAYPDWSDVQRPTVQALPRLRCPGDLPDTAGCAADLRDISLVHDRATDTLQAYDRDGKPVAFNYQGTIPQQLLPGLPQLLCLLSDPWLMVGRVDRDRRLFDDLGGASPAGVTVHPRVQRGRIVWERARWSMPVEAIPRPETGESPVRFLTRVERWRRRHELPDELFVNQYRWSKNGFGKEKPQWLAFTSPHTVWAALRQIRDEATVVDLVEALPHRGQHWARDEHGQPVAIEFAGLVRHV